MIGTENGGRSFRASRICDQFGVPLLVLGFVADWTDATQGFIVVRRSDGRIQVKGLPLVSLGKLVVHRNSPSKMQLWSASGQGLCEACKKPHVVQNCNLGKKTLSCTKRAQLTAPTSPNVITADIIQVKEFSGTACCACCPLRQPGRGQRRAALPAASGGDLSPHPARVAAKLPQVTRAGTS
jgi:hypothetical protein